MTDKVNIWIRVQSNDVCPFTQNVFTAHPFLAGHWAGTLSTARNRKAQPLPAELKCSGLLFIRTTQTVILKTFLGSILEVLRESPEWGPGICILRFLCEMDTACLQTDIWPWQIIKQQQSPVSIMICGRHTVSSENLEGALSRNTEKENIDEPETWGWKEPWTSFSLTIQQLRPRKKIKPEMMDNH